MQWNNNVYRYQPQSLLYVAFFFLVLFSLLIKAGVGFFKLHKHARIFLNGNFSHVIQLEHFSLQSSKTICLEASTRDCVQMRKTLAWILFQNSRPGLPYTELVILLPGDFCVISFSFFFSFF